MVSSRLRRDSRHLSPGARNPPQSQRTHSKGSSMKVKGLLVLLVFLFAADLFAQAPLIEYTVSARNPISHLYTVEMLINGVRGSSLDIAMPAWSPGALSLIHISEPTRLLSISYAVFCL